MLLSSSELSLRSLTLRDLNAERKALLTSPPRHRGGFFTPREIELNLKRIDDEILRRI